MFGAVVEQKIDAAIRFFMYVLIFWLPYSPAVIETCVILAFVLWLIKRSCALFYNRLYQKNIWFWITAFSPPSTILNPSIGYFLGACLLSVLGSMFFADSMKTLITKILEWFIIYFLIVESFTDKKHFFLALGILVFTSLSTILDSLIQFYITYKDIFVHRVINAGERATAGFKTPNDLGGYLALIIPVLFSFLFMGKKKGYFVAYFIFFALSLWALYTTNSRCSWFAVMAALLLFMFVYYHDFLLKRKLKNLALIVFCTGMVFIFFSMNNPDLLLKGRSETVGWRMHVWEESWGMIKDKPIFGHGINTFMRIFQEYSEGAKYAPTYAHSSVVQMITETGFLGLLCFLAVILQLFRTAYRDILKDYNKNSLHIISLGLMAGAYGFFLQSMFDTSFQSLQLSSLFWFAAGLMIVLDNLFKKEALCDITKPKIFYPT